MVSRNILVAGCGGTIERRLPLGSRFRNSLEQCVAVYTELISGSHTLTTISLLSNFGKGYKNNPWSSKIYFFKKDDYFEMMDIFNRCHFYSYTFEFAGSFNLKTSNFKYV